MPTNHLKMCVRGHSRKHKGKKAIARKKEITQAHNWVELIEVECPYCHETISYYACPFGEGDRLTCEKCGKLFELGEQK